MANQEIVVVVKSLDEEAEATLFAENSKEKVESINPDPISEATKGESSMKDEHGSYRKWPTREEIIDPEGSFLPKWKKIFIISCLLAVVLDPMFLYVPVINQDMKCLESDNNLKITALILRSLTDLFYIIDIIVQIYRSESYSGLIGEFRVGGSSKLKFLWNSLVLIIAKTIWPSSNILINILAILPLPQVLILIFFSKMRSSSSLNAKKIIMNFFVLVQYVPRVLRIYLSCKEPKKPSKGEIAMWVKGVLNFFMYILASHVLGAVWYFFAIQRMIVCWQYACRNEDKCDTSTFGCDDHHTFRNITYLNDLCPVSVPDTTLFDFGIFTSVLQSGITSSTSFLQKFSNCFYWGLRNLSSLGSNLEPSTNTWENFFGAFISIIGLLLFIYLIGNLQTYMQLDTARKEEYRHKIKVEGKMEEMDREIELWLPSNGIPKISIKDIKSQIMKKVKQELEEDRDVDVEKILSILPHKLQIHIKSCMPLSRLKQVPVLQDMDEQVLKEICKHLKPMNYNNDDIIIREEEPLKMMFFILDGVVNIEKRNCTTSWQRSAGEFYGEELSSWLPSWNDLKYFLKYFPEVFPVATETVRALGDVEALVFMDTDMETVSSKFMSHFCARGPRAFPFSDRFTDLLKKVPKLQTMNFKVLVAICEHLKPMIYPASTYIIEENERLEMMVFIMGGCVKIESTSTSDVDASVLSWETRDIYGEELLDWALDLLFPTVLPFSTSTVQATSNVKALVLTAKDLYNVVCNFEEHFIENQLISPPTDVVRFNRLGLGNW